LAGGRPTKYTPGFIVITLELMAQGYSKTKVAATLGVHKDTLYEWMKVHPDFSDAIRAGETLSEAWWEDEGRQALTKEKYNTPMFKWLTGNIHGWSDKSSQQVDISGDLSIGSAIEKARRRVPVVESK